jgi:hypothetical protein
MQNLLLGPDGQTLTEEELEAIVAVYGVLMCAKQRPFKTKSDLARKAANEVALAASEGMLTTKLNDTTYTNVWMVTSDGLDWMEGFDEFIKHNAPD